MGSLRLRPSCAAWCAQARHRVCHGHREEEMATLTSASLHVLGAEDSGEGSAGTVADVCELHVSLTQLFFLHMSQREDMKHAKGRCQGPFSEHVLLHIDKPGPTRRECTTTRKYRRSRSPRLGKRKSRTGVLCSEETMLFIFHFYFVLPGLLNHAQLFSVMYHHAPFSTTHTFHDLR